MTISKRGDGYAVAIDGQTGGIRQFYDAQKKAYLTDESVPLAIVTLLDGEGGIRTIDTLGAPRTSGRLRTDCVCGTTSIST